MSVLRADSAATSRPTASAVRRRLARAGVGFGAVTLFVAGMGSTAHAAPGLTDDGTTEANVVVQSSITLSGLTPEFTLTGLAGATVEATGNVTYTVLTNNQAGYNVTVLADTPNLLPATPTNLDVIPVSALSVRETGTPTFTPLSTTTPVQVHTQPARSVASGDLRSTDYQVVIPFVNEDTYTTTLTYLATTL